MLQGFLVNAGSVIASKCVSKYVTDVIYVYIYNNAFGTLKCVICRLTDECFFGKKEKKKKVKEELLQSFLVIASFLSNCHQMCVSKRVTDTTFIYIYNNALGTLKSVI